MRRIFVKSVNWVGDAVLVTPTLRALRRTYPQARITLLARPWVADVFAGNPDIDEIWTAEETKSCRNFLDTTRRMRKERFDLGLAFPNSFGSAALMALGGVKRRVGYNRDGRRLFLTDPVAVTPEILKVHQVEYYLNLLNGFCDVASQSRELIVPPVAGAEQEVSTCLSELGVSIVDRATRPIVALSPGAAFGTAKRWLPERYAAAADYLTERYHAQVVILGSKGERPVAEEVAAHAKNKPAILNGLFPLRGVVALCDWLSLLVTNDSGLMHVGAARNVPLVAIFGSTDWVTTAPYHPDAIIVRRAVPCSPCLLRHCPPDKGHVCMKQVTVDDVTEAIDKQMARSIGAGSSRILSEGN